MTTIGVYTLAKRVMKFSVFALFSEEFSTSSSIFATVESEYGFVTRIFSKPFIFTLPLITSSPTVTSRGALSPVSAAVFIPDEPKTISPSSGTRSPGLITTVSPT